MEQAAEIRIGASQETRREEGLHMPNRHVMNRARQRVIGTLRLEHPEPGVLIRPAARLAHVGHRTLAVMVNAADHLGYGHRSAGTGGQGHQDHPDGERRSGESSCDQHQHRHRSLYASRGSRRPRVGRRHNHAAGRHAGQPGDRLPDISGHGNRAMPTLPRMPPTQTSSSTSMATVPSRKNSLPGSAPRRRGRYTSSSVASASIRGARLKTTVRPKRQIAVEAASPT